MKLNKNQLAVLEAVKAAKKATYPQAITNGGNGRTVGALVESKMLEINQPKGKSTVITYSLTKEATTLLKNLAKAEALAAKASSKLATAV